MFLEKSLKEENLRGGELRGRMNEMINDGSAIREIVVYCKLQIMKIDNDVRSNCWVCSIIFLYPKLCY